MARVYSTLVVLVLLKTSTTEVVVEAHRYIVILGMVTVGGMVID